MPATKPNAQVDKQTCIRKIALFGEELQTGGLNQPVRAFNIRQSNIEEKEAISQLHYYYSKTNSLTIFAAALDGYICFKEIVTKANNDPVSSLKEIWRNALLSESPSPFETDKLHLFGSDFQCRVWKSLIRTREGQLASYSQIAKLIGQPQASRAVATAIAANRIAISIPCHRIIRNNGNIGDFKWGKGLKQHLIKGEHRGELFL